MPHPKLTANFHIEATEGEARAGWVETARGRILTPCFMPVGSRGVVKLLSAQDMDDLGAQVVLANTYHLMLRPGVDVVGRSGWPAPLHGLGGPLPHRLRRVPGDVASVLAG